MTDKNAPGKIYKEQLEEKIIGRLAEIKEMSIRDAMDIFYNSRLSQQINDGKYGIENIFDEIISEHYQKEK